MAHLAMQEVDDSGSPVTWDQHLSDKEYAIALRGDSAHSYRT